MTIVEVGFMVVIIILFYFNLSCGGLVMVTVVGGGLVVVTAVGGGWL